MCGKVQAKNVPDRYPWDCAFMLTLDRWDCQTPMRFGWAMLAGSSLAQSASFSGFFYTQAESCSQSFIYACPPASNASH